MANAGVFDTGYQQGFDVGSQPRLRKQALSDQEFLEKHAQLVKNQQDIQAKLGALVDADGKPLPGYDETLKALQDNVKDIREHWHPEKAPGMIQKFGHLLTNSLGITKPQPTETMVIPNPKGMKEAGNLPIWNRPAIDNGDGTHSSEYSVSFQDPKTGYEVLIPTVVNGKFLTPDGKKPKEGSPEEKTMFQEAWKHYLDTGQNLGKFANPADADAYATVLHNRGNIPPSIQKQEAKTAAQTAADKGQAESLAAAAPLSAEQTSAQQTQAQIAAKQAAMDATLDWAEKHGVVGADLEDLRRHLAGLTVSKLVPLGKPYKGPDGKYYQPVRDPDTNEITDEPMPPNYTPPVTPPHPGTSKFSQYEAAYRHDHNIPDDQPLTVSDINYINQQSALSSGAPSSTVTTTVKQDINGWYVPITETNRRIPGLGTLLADPRGAVTNPGGLKDEGVQNKPTTPENPTALKERAKKLAPKPAGASSGSTRVGQPLFAGRTPGSDAAFKAEDVAHQSFLDLEKAAASGSPVDSQGMVMAWLRGRVNRVTATEISSVRNLGNVFQKFDGNVSSVTRGTMTPEQMQWFVQSAKENYDSAKQVADDYRNAKPGGTPGETETTTPQSGASGFNWSDPQHFTPAGPK